MKLALISDTHGQHHRLAVPRCDVLVHAGDGCRRGRREEQLALLDWLAEQPATHVVLTAGNHDRWAEAEPASMRRACERRGLHYLIDSAVELDGRTFWGSPVTPRFKGMAFNRGRGAEIRAHWDLIPAGLDVLVTHGPPRGILDRMFLGLRVGCEDLRDALSRRPPRLHVFGHIHEAAGRWHCPETGTEFVNAASHRLLLGLREVQSTVLPDRVASPPSDDDRTRQTTL